MGVPRWRRGSVERLQGREPDLAMTARRLLAVAGVGPGYLATVAVHGSPRIHPVNPFRFDGDPAMFVVPSPKLEDLRRDGRYALHISAGSRPARTSRGRLPRPSARRARTRPPPHSQVLWSHFGSPPLGRPPIACGGPTADQPGTPAQQLTNTSSVPLVSRLSAASLSMVMRVSSVDTANTDNTTPSGRCGRCRCNRPPRTAARYAVVGSTGVAIRLSPGDVVKPGETILVKLRRRHLSQVGVRRRRVW